MVKKYKYDHLYYGENPYSSYSETEAHIIKATVFSVGSEDSKSTVDFCLDTGADNKAVIPSYILNKLGSVSDYNSNVRGWDGEKKDEPTPVYSIRLRIEELNFNEIIEAIATKNQFGLLPRTIINKWTILLDAPNKEFTITIND